MLQFISNSAHFSEVLTLVSSVRHTLWIGTADIKDLYVGECPILGVLAELIGKGREVRLLL